MTAGRRFDILHAVRGLGMPRMRFFAARADADWRSGVAAVGDATNVTKFEFFNFVTFRQDMLREKWYNMSKLKRTYYAKRESRAIHRSSRRT